MPVHDWTQVDAGIFHDFHTVWIGVIRSWLNEGILPNGYYALAEQHYGRHIGDLLTLHAPSSDPGPKSAPSAGGLAVAESPPKTRHKLSFDTSLMARGRTLAIRHVSGHRLVALIEIVSPANRDRPASVEGFAEKAAAALEHDVNLLIVDLFPPGPHDPRGMHGAILSTCPAWEQCGPPPADEPLTLSSFAVGAIGARLEARMEHVAVGAPIPRTPLFLSPEHYVYAPLEETYQVAYRGMPAFWRDVLEGKAVSP